MTKHHFHFSRSLFGGIVWLLLLNSCANYRPHLANPSADNQTPAPDEAPLYSALFVGDIGYEPEHGLKTLRAMNRQLKELEEKGVLLLLGDIIGPDGFRNKDEPATMAYMDELITELNNNKAPVFYTPGESELGGNSHFSRLERLEKYVKKHSDKKIKFLPNKGCGGPDDEVIFDDVGLIGASTAWYLADWRHSEEVSEGCDYNSRADFLAALADEVKGYRDRVKIVMMHHALESTGNRGGRYSMRQHLFPLTDMIPGAYLPLPILGTIARGLQASGGGRQDLTSLRYKDLIRKVQSMTEDEDMVIFLGAHEHNMLYVPKENHHIVVAGSGSVRQPATMGKGAQFAYGAVGFGRLDFYSDESVYLRFFTIDKAGNSQQVFQKRIIENRREKADSDLVPIAAETISDTEVMTPAYGGESKIRSATYEGIWGKHYRDLYFVEVKAPVLNLDTIHGGITPYRRGGGQTTQSLHTKGGNGRLYQIRSIRKNPVQLLPGALERSVAADLTRDQFTAMHPYAPLTLPIMQRKLGLLGADPGLYYMPKQPGLGSFNVNFGGELYWLEQRPDEDWSGTGLFADSKNIISNSATREIISEDWKHRVDQRNYLRARLFDLLIGDWDRHRDQWRWAEIKEGKGHSRYLPIARDRDQTYSNYDGGLIGLTHLFIPDARKIGPFRKEMGKAKWKAINGKWNDRFFLTELTLEDFEQEAQFIQTSLSDELIDEAMQAMPEEVLQQSLEREDIDGKLKARRDQLLDFARDYYFVLSEVVTVTATNKDDYVIINSLPDGNLRVQVFDANKKGEADEMYYDRIFLPNETKEVRIYGLDGDDRFELNGAQGNKIRVRIIGGTDKDEVTVNEKMGALVYDGEKGMKLKGNRNRLRDRRTNQFPELNHYHFEGYLPNYTTPYPIIGFNVDDGFYFGLGANHRRYGFPIGHYRVNHRYGASYSTNGTIKLDYLGEFNSTFGPNKDFLLNLKYRSPEYVVNFFGVGNDTPDPADDREFNRSRQERLHFSPTLRLRGQTNRTSLSLSPYFETFQIDRDEARDDSTLIGQPGILPDRVFKQQEFIGGRLVFSFNNLAIPQMPDNGMKIRAFVEANRNLGFDDRSFFRFGGALSYYQFFGKQVLGIASRIGFEHIIGEFEFYQAAQLGGRTNFRAARSERFLGNTAFYHNIDLRLRGFGIGKNSGDASGGLIAGFDYGRVWLDEEDSDTWHIGYGGGLWYAPFDLGILSATYFTSPTAGARVNVAIGFPF